MANIQSVLEEARFHSPSPAKTRIERWGLEYAGNLTAGGGFLCGIWRKKWVKEEQYMFDSEEKASVYSLHNVS